MDFIKLVALRAVVAHVAGEAVAKAGAGLAHAPASTGQGGKALRHVGSWALQGDTPQPAVDEAAGGAVGVQAGLTDFARVIATHWE